MSLSIRIKGLQKRRSLSRVSTDPLIWNAKYVREWEGPRQRTSVPVRALPTRWPKMATLFALLHSCGWFIKMQKAPGACVCVKVCVGALVFHCPEQSAAKQIPWCLCYQIGCVSPSLAACWCPFRPAPRTSQLRFRSVARGRLSFRFICLFWNARSGFSPRQPTRSDVSNYSGGRNAKDGRVDAYECTRLRMSEHV